MVGFTVILLSGLLFELVDYILVKNIPFPTVIKMLLYYLPSIIVMTLPIASLFSTLLALGRLNEDSELKIMRSCGLPYWRIVIPVIIAGLAISGLTFVANERVVPWANHKFQNLLRQVIYREDMPLIEENVFFLGGKPLFYIHEVDKQAGLIKNVLIYETLPNQYPQLITAASGTYSDNNWFL